MIRNRLLLPTALVAAAAASAVTAGLMDAQDDSRQPIPVSVMQRDHMLAEMRGLLTSVNGVLRGIAANDTALIRSSAAAGGMTAMMAQMRGRGMGPGPMRDSTMRPGMGPMGPGAGMGMQARPEAFRRLGMGTHLAFDSLATLVAAGAHRDTVLGRLAAITSNCVSCHSMYRLELR